MGQGLAIAESPPPEIPAPLLVATAAVAGLVGIHAQPGLGPGVVRQVACGADPGQQLAVQVLNPVWFEMAVSFLRLRHDARR